MNADFCHNEGQTNYDHLPVDVKQSVEFASRVRDEFGISIVHLTGGEPTLHPHLIELIGELSGQGLSVQMTTNGDSKVDLLRDAIQAGLSSVNFSMHAIDTDDFMAMQALKVFNRPRDKYDQLMIAKEQNIEMALGLTEVRFNTVLVNERITGRVLDFAMERGIPIRLMRNLNMVNESEAALQNLLRGRGLNPAKLQVAVGDSGGSGTVYFRAGLESGVKVKRFGDVYLESICTLCPIKDTPECRERFYGMRYGIAVDTHLPEVRLCIDRDDGQVRVDPESIFQEPHYSALRNTYLG